MPNSKHTAPALGRAAWLLPVFVFGWLWFVLINQLRLEWTLLPQYSYGWAVPFLCAYLVWRRVADHALWTTNDGRRTTDDRQLTSDLRPLTSVFYHLPSSIFHLLFALLAFLYFPVRLVQAANPVWTLVSWSLALVVIGLTLCLLRLTLQASSFTLHDFIFPLGFFLVAVPWPTVIEDPFIQWLTRLDTRVTVELVGWLGIPAVQHGNVIEVATGEVGINDACSGIRSFQATLMISLFLGEFYRLSVFRRSVLCLGGFAMSWWFNLGRMSLLVWVAASKGIAAIAAWHDPAGVTILLACFFSLWGVAACMQKAKTQKTEKLKLEIGTQKAEDGARRTEDRSQKSELSGQRSAVSSQRSVVGGRRLLFVLAAWIVLTEIGVASWYRLHEGHLPPALAWTISWPTNNPSFKELPIEADALQMLKCDENRRAGWQEDGRQWQAIFIQWNPGTPYQLAHSPKICMTAAGHTVTTVADCEWFEVGGLRLPFTVFEVVDAPQPFFIFYCLWNDRLITSGSGALYLSICGNKLATVFAGLRASGQRSIELAVVGAASAEEAESAVRAELDKILVVEKVQMAEGR